MPGGRGGAQLKSNDARRAASIFEASLDVPEDELDSWLACECAEDLPLLEQVRRLLSLRQEAEELFVLPSNKDARQPDPAGDSLVGTILGDFRIEALLGVGGMGRVYRARQLSLKRIVALKVLAGHNRNGAAQQRFQAEIEAVALLHHPHIVRVYTTGTQDGMSFYAMELVDGPTLADVIRQLQRSPLAELSACTATLAQQTSHSEAPSVVEHAAAWSMPVGLQERYFEWVAETLAQVADGLEYAHRRHLIHRDIKPGNLLVSQEGSVTIGDFGLARNVLEPGITQSGEILGTPYYMSPEQVTAAATVDLRTDIYSLGATLYELLTLQPPFPGDSRDKVLASIPTREVPAPRHLNPRVPKDLETICLKALEKDPHDRFQSAAAMAEDLRRYTRGQTILAKRAGVLERAFRWANRHRGLAASLAALPICVAIVATLFAIQNYRLADQLGRETQRANATVFDAKIEQARALRATNSPSRRSDSLQSLQVAMSMLPRLELDGTERERCRLLVRNEAIATLALPEVAVSRVFAEERPWTVEVAFSPNFDRFAQPSRQGEVRVVNIADGSELLLVGRSEPARQLKFSPDGNFLATKHYARGDANGATVCVWDLGSLAPRPLLQVEQRRIFVADFDFGPACQQFIVHQPDHGLQIFSLESGELLETVPMAVASVVLACSSEGQLIWAEHRGTEVHARRLDDAGGPVQRLPLAGRATAIGWRQFPSELVIGTSEGDIHVWQEDLTLPPRVLRTNRREIIDVKCQSGGSLIATGSLSEQVALTDLATGISQQVSETGERLHLCSGGFSPQGDRLGFYHLGEFGFWQVADSPVVALGADRDPKLFPEAHFHPVFERLLARSRLDGIEFWDVRQKRLLAFYPCEKLPRFRFDPTGRQLFTATMETGLCVVPLEVAATPDGQFRLEVGDTRHLLSENCTRLAISRDGERLAASFARDEGYAITLFALESLERIRTVEGVQRPKLLQFSSDRTRLWVTTYSPHRMLAVEFDSGRVVELPATLPTDVSDTSQSTATGSIALRTPGDLQLFVEGEWERIDQFAVEEIQGSRVGLNHRGDLLATSLDEFTTQLIAVPTGRILAHLQGTPRETIRSYEFSPSGKQLAIAGSRNLHVWDLELLQIQLQQLDLQW